MHREGMYVPNVEGGLGRFIGLKSHPLLQMKKKTRTHRLICSGSDFFFSFFL
jgi:hypothetical protein